MYARLDQTENEREKKKEKKKEKFPIHSYSLAAHLGSPLSSSSSFPASSSSLGLGGKPPKSGLFVLLLYTDIALSFLQLREREGERERETERERERRRSEREKVRLGGEGGVIKI